ncbi:helix-turn-helix transcriptional regulator [Nonomuraea wenchangensis]
MTAPECIGPQVRIRDLRKAHGLTIPGLVQRIRAHGVNVHKDTVSNVELGYRRASEELLTAWAKALGISPLDVYQPPASQETTSTDEAGAA